MAGPTADDDRFWTVQVLARFVEFRFDAVTRLFDTRHEAEAARLSRALEDYQRGIDSLIRLHETLDQLRGQTITRSEHDNELRAIRAQLDSQIAPLHDQLLIVGRPNYMLMGGVVTTGALLVSAAWFLIGMQINLANMPQILAAEQNRASILQLRTEATQISERMRAVENNLATVGVFESESKSDRLRLNESVRELRAGLDAEIAGRLSADKALARAK